MGGKYYLRLENNSIAFVKDGVHDIQETDIIVTSDDYNKFFELQSGGKQFRVKESAVGTKLFDFIEEYTNKVEITPRQKTELEILTEKQELLQKALDGILLGGAL